MGHKLSAFINVFHQWKDKHGDDAALLQLLIEHSQEATEGSWRVGVSSVEVDSQVCCVMGARYACMLVDFAR